MIEKYLIKNELTLKRYRRFKKRKLAVASVWALLFSVALTFSAGFLANSKPLYISYKNKTYFAHKISPL